MKDQNKELSRALIDDILADEPGAAMHSLCWLLTPKQPGGLADCFGRRRKAR